MKIIMRLLVVMLIVTGGMYAQSTTGRLVGTVNSPDGVISGAIVVLKDNLTNKETSVSTNKDGAFLFPSLYEGVFTVKVTAPGFKTYTATEVKIDIAKEYSLNVKLDIGDVQETVTVTAGADMLNSTTGELSTSIEPKQITELPLNGRNPLALIGLQAGTANNGMTNTVINGQRSSSTNITRDGINIQDNFIRANATDFVPDRPNVDNIGEITITTQNAGAESGYGASQVQYTTPRGSKDFHGAAFLYNRNSAFSANTFFRNLNGIKEPFLNRNQFGGRLGGPIPFVGKERAFFFTSYEGFRLRQSQLTTRTILLPSAYDGTFKYVDSSGTLRQLNLLTAKGISGDPTVKARFLDKLPKVGNRTDFGDQRNSTGFSFNQKSDQDREAVSTRVDFYLTPKQTISGTYQFNTEYLLRPDADNGGYNSTPFGFQFADTHFTSITHQWNLGVLQNEIRGGFQKSNPTFNRNDQTDFFVTLPLVGNTESTFQKQGRNTSTYSLHDNVILGVKSHTLRFGGSIQMIKINPFGPGAFGASTIPTYRIGANNVTGQFAASDFAGGISSAQLGNANSLYALLGGLIGSADQTFNVVNKDQGYVLGAAPIRQLNFSNWALYFADQWKATRNLTLNLGVRYEPYMAINDPSGLALEPVMKPGKTIQDTILDPDGTFDFVGTNFGGNKFFNSDMNNIAPVLSFAWSPSFNNKLFKAILPGEGKSVIRGGYRMSYVNDEFVRAADNALSNNQGLSSTVSTGLINRRFSSLPSIGVPAFIVPRTYSQNNALSGLFGTVFAIDPNLQAPRYDEYNLSIQRELGHQTALEIRYVGGRSNNLVRGVDLNQIDIRDNGFLADFKRARANLILTGNPGCTTAGCQTLNVFPSLGAGGLLSNSMVRALISNGVPADLAIVYIQNGLAGSVKFLPNPSIGVADLVQNNAISRYNSLQVELRRRFSKGFYFQANYTFQKTLTNAIGTGQTRFEPFLDNRNQAIEYQRADYDSNQVFNFNSTYELPIGHGRKLLSSSPKFVDLLVGGWQFSSIVQIFTGAPVTIIDPRGTLNRAGRAGRQTAYTNLSSDEVRNLVGIKRVANGVFYLDPSVININADGTITGSKTGRAAEQGVGAPFTGQAFFNVQPGDVGNMSRAVFNGPLYTNFDLSLLKNFRITENVKFQFRVEAFNAFNHTNFILGGNTIDINSTNFGRITNTFAARVVQFAGRLEF